MSLTQFHFEKKKNPSLIQFLVRFLLGYYLKGIEFRNFRGFFVKHREIKYPRKNQKS